jgi:hypothetical protein
MTALLSASVQAQGGPEVPIINALTVVDDTPADALLPGDRVKVTFRLINFAGSSEFSEMAWSMDLSATYPGIEIANQGGSGTFAGCQSIAPVQGQTSVSFFDLELGLPIDSCNIIFVADLPDDIPPGVYTFTPSDLTGISTMAAVDTPFTEAIGAGSFTVVADVAGPEPTIGVASLNQPNAPFDVSVAWDEPVDLFVAGDVTVTGGTLSDFTALGGGDGGLASSYSMTVTPAGFGTVDISVGAGVAEDAAGNSNTVTDAVSVTVFAQADLSIEFVDDPVEPGTNVVMRTTVTNNDPVNALAAGIFSFSYDSVLPGFAIVGTVPATPCGGVGFGGASVVVLGMSVAASDSCSFDVTFSIPPGTVVGDYAAASDEFSYNLGGGGLTSPAGSDVLTVSDGFEGAGAPTVFTKEFPTDPVLAGNQTTLQFTIVPTEGTDATGLTFTDDLDAVLSGLVAVAPLPTDPCGTGSTLSGTSLLTLTGGNLLDGETCTFVVDLAVPGASASGTYPNTTSDLTGFEDDGTGPSAITVTGASDSLIVNAVVPSVIVSGPTADVGAGIGFTAEVRFSEGVTGLAVGDLDVTNGAASALTGSGAEYSVTITPAAPGAVTVQVPAASAQDVDLNDNVISNLFSVTAVTATPEINVVGSGISIPDGNVVSGSGHPSNFGEVGILAGQSTRTFTIENTGTGPLTLTGGTPVVIGGADAAEFALQGQPSSPVPPGGSSSFDVVYDPTTVATDTATITIASDDADEAAYDFVISGSGIAAPEIAISGLGTNIADGSASPNTADDTDFGSVDLGTSVAHTFTIENNGSADLTLGASGVQLSQSGSDFSVTAQPATTISTGSSTTFEITYEPQVGGEVQAVITIENDDADENPFTFGLQGTGTGGQEVNLTGLSITILDDDLSPDVADGTDFGATDVGGSTTRTFVIENTGTSDLTLSPAPALRAGDVVGTTTADVFGSADFAITSQPATTVAAGGTTSFMVEYTPAATGAAAATTIAFGTDDSDERRYDFAVTGLGQDVTAPTGFTVSFDDGLLNSADAGSTSFTFAGAEVGTTYDYSITSDGGGGSATGSGAIATATDTISSVDVSGLPDGTLTLSVTLTDAATNTSAAQTDTATLDQTAPTLVITGPTTTQTGAFTATFTFSEDVNNFALGDISVGNGAATVLAGSGAVYTATITPAADGSVTVDVAAAVAQDDVGNDNTAATQFSVEADVTVPTLAITGPTVTQTGAFTATFTFSEDVTGFALGDISVGNGAATGLVGSGAVYTATITPAADGSVTVDVAAAVAQDDAGNDNTAASQFSVEADVTAPTLTITGPTATQTGAFTATFTFSEDVTGFALGDISVGNGAATGLAGTGAVYTATITPAGDGSVTVDVAAAVAQDDAGNDNSAATQFSVEADLTAPTLTITGPTATQTGAFTATFTFSEDVTGFAVGDIAVGNGAASSLAGSGAVYTATITPTADGTVTVDVAAAVAQDDAGNDNTAAAQFSVEADVTVPGLSISGPFGTQIGAFQVSFTFTESVTGFELGDITVGNGSAGALAGSGASYTATITPASDGTVSIDVAAGVAQDAAGNGNSIAGQLNIDADLTAPTVAITGPTAVQSGAFTATITFSESPSGFDISDISVGNGAASALTSNAGLSDKPTYAAAPLVYTATITPTSDGTVTVDVAAGAVQDNAGNDNTAAVQFSVEADLTVPTLTISGPAVVQTGAFTASFDFSEDVSGFALGDITVGNGAASDFAGSGAAYTATITPTADGSVTVDVAAGVAQDDAGNDNSAATQFSADADVSEPDLDGVTVPDSEFRVSDIGNSLTLTATFDEDMDQTELPTFTFVGTDDLTTTLSQTGAGWTSARDFEVTYEILDSGASASDIDWKISDGQDLAGNPFAGTTLADIFSVEMRRGGITIDQTVVGSVDAEFDFTGDLGAFAITTTAQSGMSVFADVAEGTYVVTATAETGFSLTDLSCTGGTTTTDLGAGSATITIAPTDAVSCSFESTADPTVDPATIPTVAITLPAGVTPSTQSTVFPLANTGGSAFFFNASVDVNWLDIDPTSGSIPASGSLNFTATFNNNVLSLPPGTHTATISIVETAGTPQKPGVSSANSLQTITIPVTVTLAPREGTLTIIASTAPAAAGEGVFDYTSDLPVLNGLSLSTQGGTASSAELTVLGGTYTLTQSVVEGWRLDSISCVGDTDAGSTIDVSARELVIDLDPTEAMICTFANVRDEDFIRGITQSAIRSFMAARADQILTNSPDVSRRLRGDRSSATPNNFSAEAQGGRVQASLSTSLSAIRNSVKNSQPRMPGETVTDPSNGTGWSSLDVWFQARYSSVEDNRAGLEAESSFGLYHLGADMLVSENLLVGGIIQFDEAETVTGDWRSRVEGSGWMVGPYMVAKLDENVFLDVRGAWGQSDNTVNPIGLYTDEFETDRWMVEANLVGDMHDGNWRVSPGVGVAYFSEEQAGYTDSLGITIPGQEITIGRVNAGPEVAYRFETPEGGFWEPYVSVDAIWDYDDADVFNAAGSLQGLDSFRADARVGFNAEFANGGRISAEVAVHGLGEGDFEASSGMLRVRLPLSLH